MQGPLRLSPVFLLHFKPSIIPIVPIAFQSLSPPCFLFQEHPSSLHHLTTIIHSLRLSSVLTFSWNPSPTALSGAHPEGIPSTFLVHTHVSIYQGARFGYDLSTSKSICLRLTHYLFPKTRPSLPEFSSSMRGIILQS